MSSLDMDTAMKRYAEGDRSPEVLQALNKAADDTFDFPPLKPELSDAEAWRSDLERVLPLSYERVLHWVREKNDYIPYTQPDRKRLQVRFNYVHKSDRALFLSLGVEGVKDDILHFYFESDKRVRPEDFVQALRYVNAWNQGTRWPKAHVYQEYLATKDDAPIEGEARAELERTRSATLRLEGEIQFKAGIHQAGLEAILSAWLSGSWEFWEDAHEKWQL